MAVITITNKNFDQEVKNSRRTVLVDFWASWCGPCRMISPIIEEISNENDDIKVCKINVDDEPEISSEYNVMSIPTLIIFKNGEVVNTSVGVKSKEEILKMVNS